MSARICRIVRNGEFFFLCSLRIDMFPVELGVNVIYKLKEDSGITLGSETQAPLISLLPLQTVLSEDDQAISDTMLQEKVRHTFILQNIY